jgi:hypothetical protein
MHKPHSIAPLARLFSALTASAVLLTGITYAVLRSNTIMLEGNTISSATARLLVSTDGQHFAENANGFEFGGVEPGGTVLPGHELYFKNDGSSTLRLNVNLSTLLINPNQVRLDQVFLLLTPLAGGSAERVSFATLYDHYANGQMHQLTAQVAPGQIYGYRMQVEMTGSAVGSSQSAATLRNVNFLFNGASVNV